MRKIIIYSYNWMKFLKSRIIVITSLWSEQNLSQDKMKNTALSELQLNGTEIIDFVREIGKSSVILGIIMV